MRQPAWNQVEIRSGGMDRFDPTSPRSVPNLELRRPNVVCQPEMVRVEMTTGRGWLSYLKREGSHVVSPV